MKKQAPPPPNGYRLLKAGELTQSGDLGWFEDRGWTPLRGGHVVLTRIHSPGRVATKIPADLRAKQYSP